ncbi:MAG: ABC transporter ATP-binding protein/permease [Acidobacteria bacterium]|nr:ABC transporter ATP-binding protein/permease [Acidobacteriota bacterium]
MLKKLIKYLMAYKYLMVGVLLATLASTCAKMLYPWPMKLLVDNVLGKQPLYGHVLEGSLSILALIALTYVVLAGLNGLTNILGQRWLTKVNQKASLDLSGDLYAQMQRLSLRFHDRVRVGDMVVRLTADVEQLQKAFVSGLSMVTISTFTVLGITVTMFLVDWRFALVALVVLPPYLMIFSTFRSRVRDASRAVRSSEGARASAAYETLSSIRVLKAFCQEGREQKRFVNQMRSKMKASVQAATWEGMFSLLVGVASAVGVAIVMGYGGWRIIQGDLTLGEMYVFLHYLTALYMPLQELTCLTTVVQKASVSAKGIGELFEAAPEVLESPNAVTLKRVRGRIAFEGVWFSYEPNRPILKGIDLPIMAGEVMAVVGATGAGKSTLVSLIARFYDVTRGRVLIDDKDVRDLSLRSLRNQISIVLQDTILFSGSVRDNIAYGRPGATKYEVLNAARAAQAHEFILDLPEGYDTYVGERGVTLSGGQRQRIAIARALLKDAPILILDEPTSSVDRESEGLILKALGRLIVGRTVVIITHRQSTSELADCVAVLSDGVITEVGRPEELRANGRFYGRLLAL